MRHRSLYKSFLIAALFTSGGIAANLIIDNDTQVMNGTYNYDNITIINGGKISVTHSIELYCDSISIDASSAIIAREANCGYEAGAGFPYGNYTAGAGHAGAGGDHPCCPGSGGDTYGSPFSKTAGSAGGANSHGGCGGGSIYINATFISLNGELDARGELGYCPGGSCGAGGGSGGSIILEAKTITNNGTINVSGGMAHTPNNNYGGGGGGGYLTCISENLNSCLGAAGGGTDNANDGLGNDGDDGIITNKKLWLTSLTHPIQKKYYIDSTPTMNMGATGSIFGYYYTVDQNASGTADQTSTLTTESTITLNSLDDGTWYLHMVPVNTSFDLLTDLHSTYTLNIKADPLTITSATHPDQTVWYNNKNPNFSFETVDGIDKYYYILDQNPVTSVTSTNGTYHSSTSLILTGISEGINYLHVVGVDNIGVVGVNTSHYRVNQVYTASQIAIGNNQVSTGTINITQSATVIDLNFQFTLDMPSQSAFDYINLNLIAPSGRYVQMINIATIDNDTYQTTLDDEASTPISSGSTPYIGSFQPDNPLSDFDGESINGNWTLAVQNTGAFSGTIDWSLIIETDSSTPQTTLNYGTEYAASQLSVTNSGVSVGSLTITDVTTITDLNVKFSFNMATESAFDYTSATLQAPDGTSVQLFGLAQVSDDTYITIFDDEASKYIVTGTTPYIGPHRGSNELYAFDGQSTSGTWQMIVNNTGAFTGTLDWSLLVNSPLTRPTISSITTTASSPTDVSPIPITITFSENEVGFTSGDLTLTNSTVSDFTGSGTTYSCNIIPAASGTVAVDIAANVVVNRAYYGNSAASQFSINYDFTAPTDISLTSTSVNENSSPGTTVGTLSTTDSYSSTAHTYSLVGGTDSDDNSSFEIVGTNLNTKASFDYETKSSYNIRIRTKDSGNLTYEEAFTITVIDLDDTPPTVAISSTAYPATNTSTLPITVSFSESVTGFDEDDISVVLGSINSFTGSGDSYTFNVTAALGTVTIDIPADRCIDAAGNSNSAATQLSIVYRTSINVPSDYSTIQAGINAAVSGDTIYVVANTYNENIDFNGKNIVLKGADKTTTIIDGGGNDVVVRIQGGETNAAVLQGFTIRNGGGNPFNTNGGRGVTGGVFISLSEPTLNDLIIKENDCIMCSGLIMQGPSTGLTTLKPIIKDVQVIDNKCSAGEINGSSHSDCAGTGVHIYNTIPQFDNLLVQNNSNTSYGDDSPAGIFCSFNMWPTDYSESMLIKNSKILNNTAQDSRGCALYLDDTPIRLENVLIADNSTGDVYAGIYVQNAAKLEIINSTIANNIDNGTYPSTSILEYGTGASNLYIKDPEPIGGTCNCSQLSIINTIIWQEVASQIGNGVGIYYGTNDESVFNNLVTNSYIKTITQYSTPPMFIDSPNGNYHLPGYSPCIGAGTATGAPTTDIEGNIRPNPAGSNPDIGAYEHANANPVLDTDGPVPTISTTTTSPTNTATIPITVTFNETVSGFDETDVSVGNGTKSAFTGSGTTYTFSVTPTADGAVTVVTVDIAVGKCIDIFSNTNTAATQLSIIYDIEKPTATFSTTLDSITNVSPIPITITFNEPVIGFVLDDLRLVNGGLGCAEATMSGFSGSDNIYTINVLPTTDGEICLSVLQNACTDNAGNSNLPSSSIYEISYDITGPTPIIGSSQGYHNNQDSVNIFVKYIDNNSFALGLDWIYTLGTANINVSNATIIDASDSIGVSFDNFIVLPISDGIVTLSIPDSVVTDYPGNYNNASEVYSFISDRTPPTAIISSSLTSPTMISPIPIAISLSEPVINFVVDNISVVNGTVSNITGSGLEYTFEITSTFTDTITISFSEGSGTDSAGNTLQVNDFNIFYYTYPKVLSMTPGVSTLTWKDKKFQFVLSDRLDPATLTDENIIISTLHSSGFSPTYTYIDTSRTLTINLENSFVAADTVSITLKGSLANIYGYGFDGNGDGTPGDDYSITYTTVMLGDYDKSGVLDVVDLALLIQGFKDKDYSFELGPYSGTVPHYIIAPDSSYDENDLMAFGMTWNWQASLNRTLFRQWQDEGEEIAIETAHDFIYIDIPEGIIAYELQISYNPSLISIYSPENTGDINLTDNDEDSGIYTLMAMTEDQLALPIKINARDTDILLSFRAVGQNGEIISQLTRQLNLNAIPDEFALSQAYPNPFNPVTQIQYAIPEDIHVQLTVYDILGRQVTELVNTEQQAGYHKAMWNADQNASGLYFVKMTAGSYISIQKLMLVK